MSAVRANLDNNSAQDWCTLMLNVPGIDLRRIVIVYRNHAPSLASNIHITVHASMFCVIEVSFPSTRALADPKIRCGNQAKKKQPRAVLPEVIATAHHLTLTPDATIPMNTVVITHTHRITPLRSQDFHMTLFLSAGCAHG